MYMSMATMNCTPYTMPTKTKTTVVKFIQMNAIYVPMDECTHSIHGPTMYGVINSVMYMSMAIVNQSNVLKA